MSLKCFLCSLDQNYLRWLFATLGRDAAFKLVMDAYDIWVAMDGEPTLNI